MAERRANRLDYVFVSPAPMVRRLYWHLLGVGRTKIAKAAHLDSFDKPGAVLLWVESGEARLELGEKHYHLSPGPRFWLFNLQQPRVFAPTTRTPLVNRTIRFSGPNVDSWLTELGVAEHPEFDGDPAWLRRVVALQAKLLQLVRHRPPGWEWKVHLALNALLKDFLAVRRPLSAERPQLPEPLTRALNAIAADPFRDWKARELAVQAGLNYSSFRELFRRHLRETVHAHLQRHRVDLAQALLSDERLRIKEVAQRLHFASEYYFSHFFRQMTGLSPTEFRRQHGMDARP